MKKIDPIYNDGDIILPYQRDSIFQYTSDKLETEYLFTVEEFGSESNFKPMKVNILGSADAIGIPQANIINSFNISKTITTNDIEIKYICKPGQKGSFKIKLELDSITCGKVELFWNKKCNTESSSSSSTSNPNGIPKIDLGIIPNHYNLVRDGNILTDYGAIFENSDSINKLFFVRGFSQNFYINSAYENRVKIKEIDLIPIENDKTIITAQIMGSLAKGYMLDGSEKSFQVLFNCERSDFKGNIFGKFQLAIRFENGYTLNLYLNKICPGEHYPWYYFYWRDLKIAVMLFLTIILLYLCYLQYQLGSFSMENIWITLKMLYHQITKDAFVIKKKDDTETKNYDVNEIKRLKDEVELGGEPLKLTSKEEYLALDREIKLEEINDYGGI